MKRTIFLLIAFVCMTTISVAQVTVNVFINGIKSGQYSIKSDQKTGGIWYKRIVYKTTERLSIEVKGKVLANKMYKREVEATDGEDHSLFRVAETVGASGQFILTDKTLLKRLGRGKMVSLYLQLDPANEKSKMPSRRLFIGNLSAK